MITLAVILILIVLVVVIVAIGALFGSVLWFLFGDIIFILLGFMVIKKFINRRNKKKELKP